MIPQTDRGVARLRRCPLYVLLPIILTCLTRADGTALILFDSQKSQNVVLFYSIHALQMIWIDLIETTCSSCWPNRPWRRRLGLSVGWVEHRRKLTLQVALLANRAEARLALTVAWPNITRALCVGDASRFRNKMIFRDRDCFFFAPPKMV